MASPGSNAAVIDGVLKHWSPSQTRTFLDCPRKWYFSKVLKVEVPPGPGLAEGTATHAKADDHYLNGFEPAPIDDDTAPYAERSLRLALDSGATPHRTTPGLLVEHPHDYGLGLTAAGVPVRGRIDIVDPSLVTSAASLSILDWKTCKSFDWCKTPDELARDVQMITYAKWGFTAYPDATHVRLKHVYLSTKAVGFKPVETDPLDRRHVDSVFSGVIEPAVAEMSTTASVTRIEDVRPNYQACSAYGGCPYRDQCPGAPASTRAPRTSYYVDTQESIKMATDKITARVRAQGINPPDAAPNVTTTATLPPAPGATTSTAPTPPAPPEHKFDPVAFEIRELAKALLVSGQGYYSRDDGCLPTDEQIARRALDKAATFLRVADEVTK